MPWLQSKEEFLQNIFFSLAPIQVTQRTLDYFPRTQCSRTPQRALSSIAAAAAAVSFPMPLGFCLSPNVRDITHHHKKLFGGVWQMTKYSVFRD